MACAGRRDRRRPALGPRSDCDPRGNGGRWRAVRPRRHGSGGAGTTARPGRSPRTRLAAISCISGSRLPWPVTYGSGPGRPWRIEDGVDPRETWLPTWFPMAARGDGAVMACDCSVAQGAPTPIRRVHWGKVRKPLARPGRALARDRGLLVDRRDRCRCVALQQGARPLGHQLRPTSRPGTRTNRACLAREH